MEDGLLVGSHPQTGAADLGQGTAPVKACRRAWQVADLLESILGYTAPQGKKFGPSGVWGWDMVVCPCWYHARLCIKVLILG